MTLLTSATTAVKYVIENFPSTTTAGNKDKDPPWPPKVGSLWIVTCTETSGGANGNMKIRLRGKRKKFISVPDKSVVMVTKIHLWEDFYSKDNKLIDVDLIYREHFLTLTITDTEWEFFFKRAPKI